ncbi:hypothetical protein FI667_g1254, partial [Globisporangium splendens]
MDDGTAHTAHKPPAHAVDAGVGLFADGSRQPRRRCAPLECRCRDDDVERGATNEKQWWWRDVSRTRRRYNAGICRWKWERWQAGVWTCYGDSGTYYKKNHSNKQLVIGLSVGGALLIVLLGLTWRAWIECCTPSERNSKHRAFARRPSEATGWTCHVCYHANDIAQVDCVLCGTSQNEVHVVVDNSQHEDTSTRSGADYQMMSTPRVLQPSTSRRSAFHLNDRQQIAFERHEWKRCVGIRSVRWVRTYFDAVKIPAKDVRNNVKLQGSMIQERHLTKNERKKQRRSVAASLSSSSSDESSSHEYSYYSSSDNSGQFTIALSTSRGFVRDDRIVTSAKWRPADEYVVAARAYSKSIQRVACLGFSEKVRWFYQQSLKLSSSLVEGFHTIRIHREHVLKQSFQIFLTAPTATLRRRLRVDFMEEPGIDGGGILREWIHLICNQVFSDKLGVFQLTNSSAHQGYWISRNAGKHCRNHLQMYQFFGKLVGKALLEGLLLNVRLSIPLVKHILGAPFKLSDIRLLDETVYSSLKWILTNNNTQNLCLNFAVEDYDLIPNGSNIPLNDGNKNLYVEKVMQYYLFDSVKAEIASIMEGVRSVIPETMLHIFDYKELDLMLSGLPHIDVLDWRANSEVRMLGENVDKEIKVVEWFWEILESFNQDGRSRLLQYVTGSSGVPVEGFQGLTGMDGDIQLFTIQLANSISKVYTVLPHASTCLNRAIAIAAVAVYARFCR